MTDRRRIDWGDELMRGVLNRYGHPRAVADATQIDHLAAMIEHLEEWEPASHRSTTGIDSLEMADDGHDSA